MRLKQERRSCPFCLSTLLEVPRDDKNSRLKFRKNEILVKELYTEILVFETQTPKLDTTRRLQQNRL